MFQKKKMLYPISGPFYVFRLSYVILDSSLQVAQATTFKKAKVVVIHNGNKTEFHKITIYKNDDSDSLKTKVKSPKKFQKNRV